MTDGDWCDHITWRNLNHQLHDYDRDQLIHQLLSHYSTLLQSIDCRSFSMMKTYAFLYYWRGKSIITSTVLRHTDYDVRPFKCDYHNCGRTFSSKHILGIHKKNSHICCESTLICPSPHCGKKLNNHQTLRKHMIAIISITRCPIQSLWMARMWTEI